MTTNNTDQDKLIDFITNPTVIAAAVEGSMDKRQAVLEGHTYGIDHADPGGDSSLSLCPECQCMTKDIAISDLRRKCGKCGSLKLSPNKPRSPEVGGELAAKRLVRMVATEYSYRLKASEDGTVTPLQIALVLRALADDTTLMAATSYARRSLNAVREGKQDDDEYWPVETSIGWFLQDTARQIEDGDAAA